MKTNTLDAYNLFHAGTLALARAEQQGICVDMDYVEEQHQLLTEKIERCQKRLTKTELFAQWEKTYGMKMNIHSNAQLARVLYREMGITPSKFTVKAQQGSTDEGALKQLEVPGLEWLLKIRQLTKVRDTYLGGFAREQRGGIIHPFFHLHTVRTYRSSSSDPNFQNIPKRDEEALRICRGALRPRPGHQFIEADFSALEVMISACYHKDPTMLEYLHNPKSDMHLDIAKQIFKLQSMDKTVPAHNTLRQAAKNGFVFPEFYGDYYAHCAAIICNDWINLPQNGWQGRQGIKMPSEHISDHLLSVGIKSFPQFTEHVKRIEEDFWGRRFQVYAKWREDWVQKYQRRGYLRMLTGFTCSGEMQKNEIINYPIQGTAFHCLLWTFVRLDEIMREEKWDSRLVGQIHDSILTDAHPGEREHVQKTIQHIVEEELPKAWKWIIVPLKIEMEVYGIDESWAGAKS